MCLRGSKGATHHAEATLRPDFEYAIHNREVNVSRYLPFSLAEERLISREDDRVVLETTKPGRLNALHWTSHEAMELEGDDARAGHLLGGAQLQGEFSRFCGETAPY